MPEVVPPDSQRQGDQVTSLVVAAEPVFVPPTYGEAITSAVTGNTYTIGPYIGEGNYGTVYQCTDTWGNDLAVKVLKPKGTYEEVRRNAIAESQKLLALRHPNVTYVHDVFEYRHTFYIVCQRCWQSINEFVKARNYGAVWLKPLARQLLQAVHFLHSNQYVHQDIHGGNVFIATMSDELAPDVMVFTFLLGDLGITKMVSDIDAENTVLADWMRAPEAISPSEFGHLDHRMDIYHCGLLFLQVLIGRELTFTRQQVLDGAPREMALKLGHPYSFGLEKALRRHVDFRTASAMEFWRDLNTVA